jgi:sugar-specific transcriptional regulator TrmB
MKKTRNFEAKKSFELLPELVNLGLSEQEAQVYLTLVESGALSAKEIGKTINVFPHTIYRTAKKLETKKLIAILKTSPITYQVLSPQLALSLFIKDKSLMMEKKAEEIYTKLNQKQNNSFPTKIDLIIGKSEMFRQSTKMINETKKELLIISIGEPVQEDCLLAIRNSCLRGVKIKMIAHKYNKENKEILENFQKNGYEIRHYPDWGFHMVIYDADKALLAVNNPQNTEERVSMQIFSHGLTKALRDYFYSVWNKSIPI